MKLNHFKNSLVYEIKDVHAIHGDVKLRFIGNTSLEITTSKFLLASVSRVFKASLCACEYEDVILLESDLETVTNFIDLVCTGKISLNHYDDIVKVKTFAKSVGFLHYLSDPEDAFSEEDFKVKLEPVTELKEADEYDVVELKVEDVLEADEKYHDSSEQEDEAKFDEDFKIEEFSQEICEPNKKKRKRRTKVKKEEDLEKTKSSTKKWKKWECDQCEASFWREYLFRVHMAEHIGDKALECQTCQKVLTSQKEWEYHKHFMHKEKETIICDFCGKSISKTNMRSHMKHKHSDERPFACHLCNFRAKFKFKLEEHIITHDEEPRFICDLCGKKFKNKGSLQLHLVVHGKKPGYPCDICNKIYKSAYDLKVHLDIHAGKLQVTCDICGKVYTTKHHLKRHKDICGRTKFDVKCKLCAYECFKKNFRKHVIVHHSGTNAYKCPFCHERFKHSMSLVRHKKSAHPGQISNGTNQAIDPEFLAKLIQELMMPIE